MLRSRSSCRLRYTASSRSPSECNAWSACSCSRTWKWEVDVGGCVGVKSLEAARRKASWSPSSPR
eukprot:scaffold229439_cov29-Tisochrysis_lutea.AAC.3